MDRAADLALAQRAALVSAPMALGFFQHVRELQIEYKSDGSYVTDADRQVEGTVRSILLSERPNDACLGEETGESGNSQRRWILDGIDGTAVFLRGDTSWQTLIALEDDSLVTVAIASVPALGKVWWAVRDGGAYVGEIHEDRLLNPQPLHVERAPATVEGCRAGVVPAYESLAPMYRAMVDDLLASARLTPWRVHAGLLVATGELDLAVQLAGKIWDYAAPSLIVEEAGGVFSGSDGIGHPVYGNAVYSRDRTIHEAALKLLHS